MSAVEIRSLNGHKIADETARKSVEQAKTESKQYTDTKISQLINSAPTTLDTLGEIAAAMAENATVVEALDAAIGQKAGKDYVDEAIANLPKGEPDWNAKSGEEGYIKNRTHWEEINYGDVLFNGTINVTASEEDDSVSGNFTMVKRIGHQPKCMMTIDGVMYEVYAGLDDPYLRLDCFEANFSVFANSNDELNAQLFAWESFLSVGSHEVKIVEIIGESVIHQLDPKFIPTASEEQLVQLLMDIDALPAMTDSNGAIFTHKDSILLI